MEKNNPVETDLIRPALAAVCERMTMLQQAQLLVAALRIERGDPEPAGRRGTGPRRLTADGLRLLERFWNFYEAHAEKLNHSRKTGVIALRLDECEKAAAEEGCFLPVLELAELLPFSFRYLFIKKKNVFSRLRHRAVRCLTFRAGEPNLFQNWEAGRCD